MQKQNKSIYINKNNVCHYLVNKFELGYNSYIGYTGILRVVEITNFLAGDLSMRKYLIPVLGAMMLAGISVSAFAAATPTTELSWVVTVSMNDVEIDLTRADTDNGLRNWGTFAPNANAFSDGEGGNPRLTLSNLGNATIDYGVQASVSATSGTAWTLGTTLGDTGMDQCVLAGIFTRPLGVGESEPPNPEYERDLVLADFGDEDVLGGTMVYGDDTTPNVLARNDTGTDDDDWYFEPYDCPTSNSERSLRLLLQMPDLGSNTAQMEFLITIGARVSS